MKTVKILLLVMLVMASVSMARSKRNNRATREINGARLIGNDRTQKICVENSGVLDCYEPGSEEIPR